MKKRITLLFVSLLILVLVACSGNTLTSTTAVQATLPAASPKTQSNAVVSATRVPTSTPVIVTVEYDTEDLDTKTTDSDISYIELKGSSIDFVGSGATVDGSVITITSAGIYSIAGTLDDGQIVVNTADQENVNLILNGMAATCSTNAPLYIANAEKVIVTLAEGTENVLTDGTSYVLENAESDEPNAALFSNDDLTIKGSGSLTVNANYKNGIVTDDDLKITGGSITVNAANDGIKGKDSVAIKDGTITINAAGDGLQSTNAKDAEKGTVLIEGGTINITAGKDGIQAETSLLISNGTITIVTGGGSANGAQSNRGGWGGGGSTDSTVESTKGLKATVDITIQAGTIHIDAADDAVNSNGSLNIHGGQLTLASGDDGLHADAAVQINGGELNITQCYEGIESMTITIQGGTIHVTASDDGINASDGTGAGGQNPWGGSGNNNLYVSGGYIYVDAAGDGLDVNGSISMSDGILLVNGPTNDGNGALDYDGSFTMSGGFLVAAGSSGMAQGPDSSSTQYSLMQTFSSRQAAGTMVHIESQDGQPVLTFVPTKQYQSVVFSAPELENGSTYIVYSGGSSTGTVADGLYAEGTYTPGSQVATLTASNVTTGFGPGGGMPGRPGGNRPGRPGG